ncbi:helix-turn-helix transcriptional regulator [Enterococcus gallinarum]|uniref:helix-turn-helix transcriptional regulator n=1 Tax=Enterococcus gallinarum TaxID=1353 RepID=UPI003D6B7433
MANKIVGYRKMVSMTQKEMAACLGISENQYRAKEKGRYDFTKSEMGKFCSIIQKSISSVNVQDIFF